MKTYVITLSKTFLSKHSRAGENTDFAHMFENGLYLKPEGLKICRHKIHTIRGNYPLWKKRIEEVQNGKAVLSVRQWTGKPYRSPQETLATLTHKDGIGIQQLNFSQRKDGAVWIDYPARMIDNLELIANNDGLSYEDWAEWFKDSDKTKPLAIIHFTRFRY